MTVAAVIEQDGRYLLVRERSEGRLVYNQPAGHLEDKESLLEAVMRETLEETGWQFEPLAVIGLYRWRHPVSQATYMRVCFSGQVNTQQAAQPLDPDIEGVAWLNLEQIRARAEELRSPMVMRSIQDHRAGITHPLSLLADIE